MIRSDKIRLLGFTTLHDTRRYAIPQCATGPGGQTHTLAIGYSSQKLLPNVQLYERRYLRRWYECSYERVDIYRTRSY